MNSLINSVQVINNEPLPEPMLTKFYDAMWCHYTTTGFKVTCTYVNIWIVRIREGTNSTIMSKWARWRLKSPASALFAQLLVQAQIKENIKASRYWPLCGEFTGDRCIPHTKGQWRGKCFVSMTSSWSRGEREWMETISIVDEKLRHFTGNLFLLYTISSGLQTIRIIAILLER